jgi:DNA-binding MarR family transcriptional regulator
MARGPNRSSLSIGEQVEIAAREFGADLDPTILALTLTLYRTTAVYDRAHSAELAPHDITLRQFNVLTVLHRADGPLTMAELSEAVAVRPGNLTSVVDGVRRRRLVDCAVNPDDRRSFLVSITDAGTEFLAGFLPGHWRYLQLLTGGLSADEKETLVHLLEKLLGSVQDAAQASAGGRNGVAASAGNP